LKRLLEFNISYFKASFPAFFGMAYRRERVVAVKNDAQRELKSPTERRAKERSG